MTEHTSSLPFGKPFPIADEVLWNALMSEASSGGHFDVMQRYADIRGISRQDAKSETFMLRYSGMAGVSRSMVFLNKAR